MSFSSDLKEELSKINNLNKKDEVRYELIGYLISKNATIAKRNIRYATESEYNINRFSKLLRNLNIDNEIEFDGKSFIITFKIKNLIKEIEIKENQLEIRNKNVENENYKRAIVRGTFLGAGSINNPNKTYHLEINLSTKENMEFLYNILKECKINCKRLLNKKSIYLKDGKKFQQLLHYSEQIAVY